MPTTADKPFVISIPKDTAEWKIVETIRGSFVTLVNDKDGKPKLTSAGAQQTRKVSGDDVASRILASVLVHASKETLTALADEALDKKSKDGKEPKYKTREFIESISTARERLAPFEPKKSIEEMTDEELEAEEKRIQEVRQKRQQSAKASKGTKDVAPV